MTRRFLIILTAMVAVAGFGAAAYFYKPAVTEQQIVGGSTPENPLVRDHSPILGPPDAPVTIVEFFDPACEACRAFHPVVKQIMNTFPGQVRVVLRYATFHKGSDEAARILELARLQGVFEPVLEKILEAQPLWANHGAPDIAKAWDAARAAGLDVERARPMLQLPEISAALSKDNSDVHLARVTQTPTFFVNGQHLPSFGTQQLYDLVESEVLATTGVSAN